MPLHRVLVLLAAASIVLMLGGWGHEVGAHGEQDVVETYENDGSEKVTLKIGGDRGARFSGACSVAEDRRELAGQAPRTFDFVVAADRKLSCEIRRQGAHGGALKVVLDGEHIRSMQRVEGENDVVRLTYDGGNVSSSISSSSSKQVGGNFSFPAAEAVANGEDDMESLADRIQQRADEIVERAEP